MSVTKHQRQHRITKLLEAKAVGSQSHLVDLLAGRGSRPPRPRSPVTSRSSVP